MLLLALDIFWFCKLNCFSCNSTLWNAQISCIYWINRITNCIYSSMELNFTVVNWISLFFSPIFHFFFVSFCLMFLRLTLSFALFKILNFGKINKYNCSCSNSLIMDLIESLIGDLTRILRATGWSKLGLRNCQNNHATDV